MQTVMSQPRTVETPAEKRDRIRQGANLRQLLHDPTWCARSDQIIAATAGVDPGEVRRTRRELQRAQQTEEGTSGDPFAMTVPQIDAALGRIDAEKARVAEEVATGRATPTDLRAIEARRQDLLLARPVRAAVEEAEYAQEEQARVHAAVEQFEVRAATLRADVATSAADIEECLQTLSARVARHADVCRRGEELQHLLVPPASVERMDWMLLNLRDQLAHIGPVIEQRLEALGVFPHHETRGLSVTLHDVLTNAVDRLLARARARLPQPAPQADPDAAA